MVEQGSVRFCGVSPTNAGLNATTKETAHSAQDDRRALFAEMMEGYGSRTFSSCRLSCSRRSPRWKTAPIRRIMVHGEKAAAYMADGYARERQARRLCADDRRIQPRRRPARRLHGGAPIIAITGGPTPQSLLSPRLSGSGRRCPIRRRHEIQRADRSRQPHA